MLMRLRHHRRKMPPGKISFYGTKSFSIIGLGLFHAAHLTPATDKARCDDAAVSGFIGHAVVELRQG